MRLGHGKGVPFILSVFPTWAGGHWVPSRWGEAIWVPAQRGVHPRLSPGLLVRNSLTPSLGGAGTSVLPRAAEGTLAPAVGSRGAGVRAPGALPGETGCVLCSRTGCPEHLMVGQVREEGRLVLRWGVGGPQHSGSLWADRCSSLQSRPGPRRGPARRACVPRTGRRRVASVSEPCAGAACTPAAAAGPWPAPCAPSWSECGPLRAGGPDGTM